MLNTVQHMDAIALMKQIKDQSVDAYITDLPYGTTACSWDEIIPFAPMWAEVKRTLKPSGVFITTSTQPFSSLLITSNLEMFKYEWIWEKSVGGGFLNANRRPLKRHENILVFYKKQGAYQPQMSKGKPYQHIRGKTGVNVANGGMNKIVGYTTVNEGERYPTSILKFNSETGLHPTQKPVALYEYLIRTYTKVNDLVVDFCCGSGTSLVAAQNLNRRFIGGDQLAEYVAIAQSRLIMPEHLTQLSFLEAMV